MLKIVISPYFSEKSSDFDEIWYTTAELEIDDTRDQYKKFKIN